MVIGNALDKRAKEELLGTESGPGTDPVGCRITHPRPVSDATQVADRRLADRAIRPPLAVRVTLIL